MAEAARDVLLGEILELAAEIASTSHDSRKEACELVMKLKAYSVLVDAQIPADAGAKRPGKYAKFRRLIEAVEDCVKSRGGSISFEDLLDDLIRNQAPFPGTGEPSHRLRQTLKAKSEKVLFDEETNLITLPQKRR